MTSQRKQNNITCAAGCSPEHPAAFWVISHPVAHRIGQGVMQMKCAWEEYLGILPLWLRREVDDLGRDSLKELRLRLGLPPELVLQKGNRWMNRSIRGDDLNFVINTASKYSPWASVTAANGYITAAGGHRIGICGDAVVQNGCMTGIRNPTSVCIRVARQFPGIADGSEKYKGSVLIIGAPGRGKTTLLREWIRVRSNEGQGSVAVVDERGEIFPRVNGGFCFDAGNATDVLTGITKQQGIDCVLRTMTPSCIAVDEITAAVDCEAMRTAAWSGVDLLATAHASSMDDLFRRPVYRPLAQSGLFQTVVVLAEDQTWHAERMKSC